MVVPFVLEPWIKRGDRNPHATQARSADVDLPSKLWCNDLAPYILSSRDDLFVSRNVFRPPGYMAGTRKRNALSLSRSPNIDTSEGNAGQPSRKNPRSRRGKLAILMEMPIEIFLEVSCSSLDTFWPAALLKGKECEGL